MKMLHLTKEGLFELVNEVVTEELGNGNLIPSLDNGYLRRSIDEGLIMSYAPLKTCKIFSRKYDGNVFGYSISTIPRKANTSFRPTPKTAKTTYDTEGWYDIELVFKRGLQNCFMDVVNQMIETMDRMGWTMASVVGFEGITPVTYPKITSELYNSMLKGIWKIVFQAKYDQPILPTDLPRYCYHICPCRVYEKVKRQGLTPRAEFRSANHMERVYLFLNKPQDWQEIANRFRDKKDEIYALLRIDMMKVGNIEFHYDSNMISEYPSIWTFEPIPSSAIMLLEYEEEENQ